MNDYNNGALQDPCLRLDYGFGEEWASVELGDGTGYVRLADYEKLASENAKLRDKNMLLAVAKRGVRACYDNLSEQYKELEEENAKLRELLQRTWDIFHNATAREFNDTKSELRELGIEVS